MRALSYRDAVGGKGGNSALGKLSEIADAKRSAIIKKTEAAAYDRGMVLERQVRERKTWSEGVLPGQSVTVEAQAGVNRELLVDGPSILRESGEFSQTGRSPHRS